MSDRAALEAVANWADRQSEQRTLAVRQMLIDEGRIDLLADFDANMKKMRLGITGAENAWHSISPAQRRLIDILATGRYRLRRSWSSNFYDATGAPHALSRIAGLKTIRALASRGLLDWDGSADDPERGAVLSDRGRFVWKHGRPSITHPPASPDGN